MTCDDKRPQIIAMLFGSFDKGDDKQRIAIYSKLLEDIPTELLSKSVKKLILENKFMPSIAEIVDAAKSLMGSIDDTKRTKSWDEAWGEIQRQMHDAFIYKKPVFSSPEIAEAALNFGWKDLCCTLEKDMPIVRAQVRRMYEDACRRREEQQSNNYVLGNNKSPLIESGVNLQGIAVRTSGGLTKI